jgi:hypothetical protein
MGKIRGPIMGSKTMTRDESKDGSQVGNINYVDQSGLVVVSTTQMHLSKIKIHLSLEFVY